ncbi:MAG: hypothetical protein ACYDIE_07040 [Candidatus Krumholzibacteriia bacterium]
MLRRAAPALLTGLLLRLGCLAGLAGVVAPASAGPSPAPADAAADDRPADSAAVVQVVLRPAVLAATPGRAYAFTVEFTVREGWHLYAHGDTVFYGVDLTGLAPGPLADAAVTHPAGRPDDFFGTPVRLLAGRQTIAVRGVLPDSCRAGAQRVDLVMAVQACDAASCLAPARITLPLRLEVAAPDGAGRRR